MYYFKGYDSEPEPRGYEQSLRDRANTSLDELRNSLNSAPTGFVSSGDSKQQLSKSVHPRVLTWQDGGSGPPQRSNAASQLRHLLSNQVQSPPISLGPPTHTGPLPSPEEAAALLKNHAVYTSHLEAESRYIKEEMAVLRMKLSEVLEENRSLHHELKTTVVHEILKEGGEVLGSLGSLGETFSESYQHAMGKHDFKRWQVELERLSKLHAAKTERLESQLEQSKLVAEQLSQTVEDLKSQLRIQDSTPTHENGMISSVFLSETEKHITHRTIEQLTKERDELAEQVVSLRSQLAVVSQREEEAYQQMKRGIELVEQAQLEQTQALVEKEQVCDDLARTRQRFEAHVRESQNLIRAEREAARQENQELIDDLNKKMQELGEHYTRAQARFEKEVRDKASLSKELQELKSQLRTCDREVTVTAESYRTETTNASLQRNNALYESSRLRSELENLKHEHDQESSRTKIELDDLRQRLNKAERELVNAKEECIHMTANVQALERELHLAKMARDTVERSRADDLKLLRQRAQDREEQMKAKMEEAEDRHSQSTHEMDTLLLKQNKLIMRLQEECKKQAVHLEKTTKKYRVSNSRLNQSNTELSSRMERMTQRLEELEAESDQHTRLHDKMRERLSTLDTGAQNQAVQMAEALTKYSQACRDRQLLAREVEFLRTQLHRANQTSPEVLRLNSSVKTLVDDVLNAITKAERDGTETLIPQLTLDSEVPEKISLEDLGSQ
ncbi:serologically defined colon cancer antigen 8 homolog [Aplysia californica]|uniref:Serologically defined colon cancer antigen 8 homolog n=1 Tax=Aplysia californica TaxID=6500 RepID=A0ABM0JY78_APLCA|nr:serologically defined colon cancer antigen 8 homolog [Aplysia californica]